ncbi:MAG TPA: argininosuccinate lyase [Casimicrobiaceae bacterium]|nr:argininosuccinate lyase [Casimicrobiaceae bacterium]
MPDIVRQPGARLTGGVDPRLAKRFYPGPLANLRRSYGAFHAFDKAHTVALAEAGLVPREAARAILAGLREMEAQGVEAVRDSMGGGRHSGEAYLTGKLGAGIAGWINLGRSSGDLDAVAWRYNLRARLPAVLAEIGRLRASLLDVAERHEETLLPAYSIGQQAQTTTLAHTLLSWEAPFARDAARGLSIYAEAGGSPAGSAIMTGSTFPISRERTAELLGFDSVQTNTRDAVVNLDTLLHAHGVIAVAISNAVSVASDLYLWSMSEVRFVELDDAYCSTSSIMPQKKNAWAPAWIRGQGSLALGRLSGVFALCKMESDGLEDTLLGPWQLYEALDELEDMAALLAGMVATMRVDRPRLLETARRGWTQATDLAAMLTREAGISWRDAHQILARLVREAIDKGRSQEDVTAADIDRAAQSVMGRTLGVTNEAIRSAVDPRQSVENRRVVAGSPAPADVDAQASAARAALADDNARIDVLVARQRAASERLEAAIDAVLAS